MGLIPGADRLIAIAQYVTLVRGGSLGRPILEQSLPAAGGLSHAEPGDRSSSISSSSSQSCVNPT
jgi:hypothetical protein